MAMASKQQTKTKPPILHIPKFEILVTPSDTKTTLRLANFLNPLSENPQKATKFLPESPLLSEIFPPQLHQWPSSVTFRGSYRTPKNWKQWVDQLTPKYSSIWTQAGIHQAILTSVYEIKSNPDTILGLSEFWYPNTNTFIFPWGEATISLEDIMILGGYPVLGDPVDGTGSGSGSSTVELAKLEEKFTNYRLKILREKGIKATHQEWLNFFMAEKKKSRGVLAHIAFLSIWLSRCVFPSLACNNISNSLIPIAVKLSRGVKLALGPAVLASIYRNLTFIREEALASRDKISVSGPFQLLQIWAFERFPVLGPQPADIRLPGLPRMARWDRLSLKLTLPLVRLAVKEAKNFCWRPYAAKLEKWHYPSYYKEKEQSFSDCSGLDDELRSFHRFLLVSEVVGLDCKEKYFPHRVAMQFGFDQDIPAHLSTISSGSREPVQLFVPSRSFQPSITLGYSNWWKGLMLARQGKFKDVSFGKNRDMKDSDQASSSSVQASENSQDYHAVDAAMNPSNDPESESSKDSPKVSPKITFKENTHANNEIAVREDWNEAVATHFPTTPTIFTGSSSSVSPPPGFQRMSSNAKKRLAVFEFSDNEGHEPPLLPCAKKAKVPETGKEQLPVSIQAKGCKAGISAVNLVKREYSCDGDDDVVIISDLVKEPRLEEARKPLEYDASTPTSLGRESSGKEKSSARESLKVSDTPKNFNQSSEVNAGETIESVNKATKEDVCEFATKASVFHSEIKVEAAGNSANEPFNVGFDVKLEKDSSKEHRALSVGKGGEMAGESPSNPITLDDEDTDCVETQIKHKEDVQKRLQKLEKMLGLVQE